MQDVFGAPALEVGDSVDFALGALRATVSKTPLEWRQVHRYEGDRFVVRSEDETVASRLILQTDGTLLEVAPRLADRGVVARLTEPVRIRAGGAATVYISTPLWVHSVVVSGSERLTLADVPSTIMSDTWFGPNTRVGEACYSEDTQARLYSERLERGPDRAISPVEIRNEGEDVLLVDRLNLPVTHLSLYAASEGYWTQGMTVTRTESLDGAELTFTDRPPDLQPSATKCAEPREKSEGRLTRAVHFLIGQ